MRRKMGIHTWYDPYTSSLKYLNIFTKSLLPPINNIGQTAEQMTVAKTQQEHKMRILPHRAQTEHLTRS